MIFRKIAVFLLLAAGVINLMVAVAYILLSGVIPGGDQLVANLLSGSPDGRPEAYVTTGQSVLLAALYMVVAGLAAIAALRHRKDRSPGFVLYAAGTVFAVEMIDLIFTGVGANLVGILAGVATVVAVVQRRKEIEQNALLQDRLVGFYGDDRLIKIFGGLFYAGCIVCVAGLLFAMESVLRAQPQNYLQYMQWSRSNNAIPQPAAAVEPPAEAAARPALFAGDVDDEPDDVAMAYAETLFPGLRLEIAQSGVTIADGRRFLNMAVFGFSGAEQPEAVLLKRLRLEMLHSGWKVSAAIDPRQLWEARPLVQPVDSIDKCRVMVAEEIEQRLASEHPDDLPEQLTPNYRDSWFEDGLGFGQVVVKLSTRDNYFGFSYRYACRLSASGSSLTELLPDQYVDRNTGFIVTDDEL